MRHLLILSLTPTLLGCAGDGASMAFPDAGPDLLPGVVEGPDTCGRFAHLIVGQRRTWVGRFGQGEFVTTTTVESFDVDGQITESLLSGDPRDAHGEGENHYRCDEDGLRTMDTSFTYQGTDGTVYFLQEDEYDPPILRVRRALALGDTWTESSSHTHYEEGFGGPQSSVLDVNMEYRVAAEQIAATVAGSWPALLVEGTNTDTGDIAERDWRVDGVGDVIFATYTDGVPGFAQELVSIETVPETP